MNMRMLSRGEATRSPAPAVVVEQGAPFEVTLLESELESCELYRLDSRIFSIGVLGRAGVMLIPKVARYLDPQETVRHWRRIENIDELTPANPYVLSKALLIPRTTVAALLELGAPSEPISEALLHFLHSGEPVICRASISAAAGLGLRGRSLIPRLVELLSAPEFCLDVMDALPWFGRAAAAAVPKLDRIVLRDGNLSDKALDCLCSIGIVPRTCFPRAVNRLAREGFEGKVWRSLFVQTTELSAAEMEFIIRQCVGKWSTANSMLKLRIVELLEELGSKLMKRAALREFAKQLSNDLGLFLLSETQDELLQALARAKALLDA